MAASAKPGKTPRTTPLGDAVPSAGLDRALSAAASSLSQGMGAPSSQGLRLVERPERQAHDLDAAWRDAAAAPAAGPETPGHGVRAPHSWAGAAHAHPQVVYSRAMHQPTYGVQPQPSSPPAASAAPASPSPASAAQPVSDAAVDDELRKHAETVQRLLGAHAAAGNVGDEKAEALAAMMRGLLGTEDGAEDEATAAAAAMGRLADGLGAGAAAPAAAMSAASSVSGGGSAGYRFQAEAEANPFLGGPARQLAGLGAGRAPDGGLSAEAALAEGEALLAAGRLEEATMALEAAVRRDGELSEAWRVLGNCRAEAEDDAGAIASLEEAVAADPYNVRALLDLGCSLVNELREERALGVLADWARHNPRFAHIEVAEPAEPDGGDVYGDGSEMDRVTRLMLRVSASAPGDADVASVLGLLYNISRDWAEAAAAFRTALGPGDGARGAGSGGGGGATPRHVTLNRLGATLANGGRPSQAVPLYREALRLRPGYTRAMHNLGVSMNDLGRREEAAAWFVRALGRSPDSPHVWRRLRLCLFSWDSEVRMAAAGPADGAAGPEPAAEGETRTGKLVSLALDQDVDGLARELGLDVDGPAGEPEEAGEGKP